MWMLTSASLFCFEIIFDVQYIILFDIILFDRNILQVHEDKPEMYKTIGYY
jgi:hypothetical protein